MCLVDMVIGDIIFREVITQDDIFLREALISHFLLFIFCIVRQVSIQ